MGNTTGYKYEIIMESECDFIVERLNESSGRKVRLVVLISQNQYYFEDDTERYPFTKSILCQFLIVGSDVNRIYFKQVNWVSYLSNWQMDCEIFYHVLVMLRDSEKIRKLFQKGYLWCVYFNNAPSGFCNQSDENWRQYSLTSVFLQLYEQAPQLYMNMMDIWRDYNQCSLKELFEGDISAGFLIRYNLWVNFPVFIIFKNIWGMEWTQEAMKKCIEQEIYFLRTEYMSRLVYGKTIRRSFDSDKFFDYLFQVRIRENIDMDEFIWLWAEVLSSEERVFGEVVEAYPENLHEVANILDDFEEQKYNQEMWNKAVKRMRQYEFVGEEYRIICPDTKDELRQEAVMHHVWSYEEKILRGEVMIFLVAYTEWVWGRHVSLAIEVNCRHEEVVRVWAEGNMMPTEEQMKFIKEWAGEKGLQLRLSDLSDVEMPLFWWDLD